MGTRQLQSIKRVCQLPPMQTNLCKVNSVRKHWQHHCSDDEHYTNQLILPVFPLLLSESCCSVTKSCPALCDLMDCSMPGFPALHCLLELVQIHVHLVSDAIQPSHPLSPSSSPAFNLSQHQGLFQCVSSLLQVAKVLELQNQSSQ